MIVIWSILSFLFFALFAILALNYGFYEWEEKRVNELAQKIKPQEERNSILFKSSSSREFTSFDLGSVAKSKPAKVMQNVYDKTLILLQEQKYPDWLTKIAEELNNIRKNFWQTLHRFIKYLISLTKPANTIQEAKENDEKMMKDSSKNEKKLRELDQTIEKVAQLAAISDLKIPLLQSSNTNQNTSALPSSNSFSSHALPAKATVSVDTDQQVATIGIVPSGDKKSEIDMSLFERLEARILAKLKEKGLGRYSIWLELGDLYLKFGDTEKAREVFALVLKHSEGDEKEFARNRLIGL